MADSVRVQFSASIGALIQGVEDAKQAINSVRESVDNVTEGAKGLLETFGVAFSADKIIEFVNHMAEVGDQIERTSAILGTSTAETQQLGFVAAATGTNTQSLSTSMERLQVSIQRAQNPTSLQAQALNALGLSAKELIGLPLPEQMERFADAVSKFGDGTGKTAAIGALSRGLVEMIPILDKGRSGLEEFQSTAEKYRRDHHRELGQGPSTIVDRERGSTIERHRIGGRDRRSVRAGACHIRQRNSGDGRQSSRHGGERRARDYFLQNLDNFVTSRPIASFSSAKR